MWKVRRAATLHAQKKYDETLRALEPLLAELRMPDSVAEAQYLIGTSRLDLKQPGAAVKSLAASLELDPPEPLAAALRSVVHADLRQLLDRDGWDALDALLSRNTSAAPAASSL